MNNYFKDKKIFISLFVISFVIFLIFALLSGLVAFGDTPCEFFKEMILYQKNHFDLIFQYQDGVVRLFSYKIHRLFFYLLFPLFNTIKGLSNLYLFSLLIVPFFLLFVNYFVAKRTQRYDVAVVAFLYYCCFEIPYISHVTREYHVSTMVMFIYFSYFFSKQPIKKFDIILLSIISIFLFESGESIVLLGIICFILSIVGYFKDTINNKNSLYLGISPFLASMYVFFKTIKNNSLDPIMTFEKSIPRWFDSFNHLSDATLSTCMLISVVALFLCIIFIFLNRTLKKMDLIWGFPLVFFIFYILNVHDSLIPNPSKESNLFLYSLFVPLIIFIIIWCFDYWGLKVKDVCFSNILVIALIVGVLQFGWQINSTWHCSKYVETIKEHLKKQEGLIVVHFEEKDLGYNYECNICSMFRGFLIYDDYQIKSTLLSDPAFRDYTGEESYGTYYDKENQKIYILDCPLDVENKFWDLSYIAKKIEERCQ